MKKILTAKYEVIFMYAVVKSKQVIKQIIEQILNRKYNEFVILNPNLIKDNIHNIGQKLDLLIKADDEYINVELNSKYNKYVKERNLLYVFKLCLDKSEKDKETLKGKVKQININFRRKSNGIEDIAIVNLMTNKKITTKIEIKNLNIDFYVKKYYNNYKLTKEEEIYVMLGLELEELNKLSERNEIVKKFKESVEETNKDELVVKWFSPEQEREMRENYIRSEAEEKGMKKGMKKGIVEGKKVGIVEGKKAGILEGLLQTAKNMLEADMNIETISKLTGLSVKKIKDMLL